MKRLLAVLSLLLLIAVPATADITIIGPSTAEAFYPLNDLRYLKLAGGTMTGPLLLPDGTAAAPSLAFASDPTTGWFGTTSQWSWGYASAAQFNLNSSAGVRLNGAAYLGWVNGAANANTPDTILSRISDGVLGLKSDGTSAAELRVYGDGTTGTKYLTLGHSGAYGSIVATQYLSFGVGPSEQWVMANAELYPSADNASTLGATARHIRTAHIATSLQGGGSKALPDLTATGFVKIAVAQGSSIGARIRFTIKVADATDQQIVEGTVHISAINKGGIITASTPVVTATTALVTAGTLAAPVFTVAEVDADTITVSVASDTSLTATTHVIQYFVEMNAANVVTQL